jgi:hypothetical protein
VCHTPNIACSAAKSTALRHFTSLGLTTASPRDGTPLLTALFAVLAPWPTARSKDIDFTP